VARGLLLTPARADGCRVAARRAHGARRGAVGEVGGAALGRRGDRDGRGHRAARWTAHLRDHHLRQRSARAPVPGGGEPRPDPGLADHRAAAPARRAGPDVHRRRDRRTPEQPGRHHTGRDRHRDHDRRDPHRIPADRVHPDLLPLRRPRHLAIRHPRRAGTGPGPGRRGGPARVRGAGQLCPRDRRRGAGGRRRHRHRAGDHR